MNILWITNILLPETTALLTGNSVHKGSGGWLVSSSQALIDSGEVKLSLVSVSPKVKELTELKGKEMTYYVLPRCSKVEYYESLMKEVSKRVQPDLVHIHGTEWPYGLAYMNACTTKNVLISIQGVLGVIADCYIDGLSKWQIVRNITIRDLGLKTILGEKQDYEKRAGYETLALKKAKYVIGRTSFDKQYVMSVNPELNYHFCNESLREEFYQSQWEYAKCTPHTIFLSQANYPIKGLHQILRALPMVIAKYPNVKVRIAGTDITLHKTMAEKMKYSGYGKIIYKLIRKYHLESVVSFTGLLSAQEMVDELLKSNLYVCPSSCENSSNSIAEAQILGVPCLASRRGGNPDMIPDGECGQCFEFDDIEGLAESICNMFEVSKSFDNTHVREMAIARHDQTTNLKATLSIYKSIING